MSGEQGKAGFKELGQLLDSKNGSWQNFFSSWLRNPSYIIIVVTNIAIFFIPGLDIKTQSATILWIYMVQSLMIGVVHFFKLIFYRFAKPVRTTDWKNPKAIAVFFLFHFGFFHFLYTFFISPSKADWSLVWQGASVFAFGLFVNTIRHYSQENSRKYNANDFMFLPYVRIIPIHIAIILGGFFSSITGNMSGIVVVLVVLKTVIELFLEYLQQLGVSFAELQNTEQ